MLPGDPAAAATDRASCLHRERQRLGLLLHCLPCSALVPTAWPSLLELSCLHAQADFYASLDAAGALCQFRTSLTSAGLVLEHTFSCDSPAGQHDTKQQHRHISAQLLKQVLAVVHKVRARCRPLPGATVQCCAVVMATGRWCTACCHHSAPSLKPADALI